MTSRPCQQIGNFITVDAARRQGLDPIIGSKYKLEWTSEHGVPDYKTRMVYFEVVHDEAMDVDVGLNWECLEDADEDQDNDDHIDISNDLAGSVRAASISNSRPRHSSDEVDTDGPVPPWLSEQSHAIGPCIPRQLRTIDKQSSLLRIQEKFLDTYGQLG